MRGKRASQSLLRMKQQLGIKQRHDAMNGVQLGVKRCVDIAFSALGLLVASPLLAFIALRLAAQRNGSVFFRQERIGRGGRPFQIYKFRTMSSEVEADGPRLLPHGDEEYGTRFERWLRRRHLDELPQMWNVLRGDMSLIGPRPLLPQYIPLYNKEQARRHEVRPGITGWAQCHGRNAISWTEKFRLDVWYVDHISLWTDVKVIWITIKKVLRRADITEAGQATMEAFNGTN